MGVGKERKSSSVLEVNLGQSAFWKLINVLLSLLMGLMVVERVRIIGTWSELKVVIVSHLMRGKMEREAMEISGEVV